MSEIITDKPVYDPLRPLTVAEIVAFKSPPNLAGWNLVQDRSGGYSYRATIGGIDYIGTPHEWAGRSLTQPQPANTGDNSMQSFATNGALNGVTDLSTQTAGTMQTNDPAINRALVPRDAISSSSVASPAATVTGSSIHPGILLGVVLLVAFVAAAVAGTAAFFVGRRTYGHS